MRLSLVLVATAAAARIGLHAQQRAPEGLSFAFLHLFFLLVIAYFSGHVLLRKEPHAGVPGLLRNSLRDVVLYVSLYAIFIYAFNLTLGAPAFQGRLEELVQQGVASGRPEAHVREKLQSFFTPAGYASMTFFGLLALGVLYALLATGLHHKLLRRFRQ
jgi:hypothetical protein